MSVQFKKYELDRSENFDEFLDVVGVTPMMKQALNSVTPTVQLVKEGDNSYSFNTYTSVRNQILKFNLNEEFDEDRMDGVKVKCVITFEGNKMIQQQQGDNAVRIEREFNDDELIATFICGPVTSMRWYKAIE